MTYRRILFFAALTAGVASAGPIVNVGWDLQQVLAGTTFGGVAFIGVPLGTFDFGGVIGVQGVGNASIIIQRTAPASGALIPVQMVALQLQSAAPTNFGLGVGTYFMTLQSARGGPASTGSETINFGPEAPAGSPHGTFSSSINVAFDIRLGALNGPIALSDTLLLTSSGVPWNHFPPSGGTEIAGANSFLNGSNRDADFWSLGQYQETFPTGAVISVTEATGVPEPGSLSLIAIAALAGLARSVGRRPTA